MASLPGIPPSPTRLAEVAAKRDEYPIADRSDLPLSVTLDRSALVAATPGASADDPDSWLPERERNDGEWLEADTTRRELVSGLREVPGILGTFAWNSFLPHPFYWFYPAPIEDKLNGFYETYYRNLDDVPSVVQTWHTDESFAEQRLSGANPMVIRRVTDHTEIDLLGHSVFNDDHIKQVYPDETLADAVSENRLYVCDYHELKNLADDNGVPPPFWVDGFPAGIGQSGARKYLSAPIALFYWEGARWDAADEERGKLMPLGIQLRREGVAGVTGVAPEHVILPHHPNWLIAKTIVQCADAQLHELRYHLAWTHLKLEAIKICAEREFHDHHPVLRLLRPHLRLLLRIESVLEGLIGTERPVDALLASSLDGSREVVEAGLMHGFCMHAPFLREIEIRGMSAADAPIHYSYRDDGILVWSRISNMVSRYVDLYYAGDQDVLDDIELENFVREVQSLGTGKLVDFVEGGVIQTKSLLKETLTAIIWTSGPQHAALNYPQWDYMGHVPNMPLATYVKAPADGTARPEYPGLIDTPAQYFPPDFQARNQTGVMYIIGTWRSEIFGTYDMGEFTHDAEPAEAAELTEILGEFGTALMDLERSIRDRDRTRAVSYPYLHPTNIPNSTNI